MLIASLGACRPAPYNAPDSPTDELALIAQSYLSNHIFKPAFGGQIFCESETFQTRQQGSAIKAYLWVLCAEYYREDEVLQIGTAVSEPLLVYLIERNGGLLATGFAEPRSGERFAEDLHRIFPVEALRAMCLEDPICSNARVERLLISLEQQVGETLKLPLATGSID